uniref:Nucleic acid-binding, OB-fold protein n=1 Tax=Tanacetum cinerariifolium TaxID=118510 RepID=A0A6L2JKX2_TANCI|nr:nucleic acid-binding, OB-fold protein [Tanacetum cinerariifolium]
MRLNNDQLYDIDKERVSAFVQWLLDIGNGNIGTPDDFDLDNSLWVDILDQTYTYVSYADAIPHGHDGGEGTPIQANMDVKDAAYFDHLLQLRKAYRISGFSYEQTGLQLSERSATHYYLNQNIHETYHIKQIYYFKVIINDGTATMSVTCFSDQANTLTRDCNELLVELPDKDSYQLPSTLKNLEVRMTKVIKGEFEQLKNLKVKDVSLTCDTSLKVFNNEFNQMSRMDDDLFTYEVEVANIPCDSNKDDDSKQRMSYEADDDTGYDPSDVVFTKWLGSKKINYMTMDQYTKNALWIYWIIGDDEVELTDEDSSDNEDDVAKAFRIDAIQF